MIAWARPIRNAMTCLCNFSLLWSFSITLAALWSCKATNLRIAIGTDAGEHLRLTDAQPPPTAITVLFASPGVARRYPISGAIWTVISHSSGDINSYLTKIGRYGFVSLINVVENDSHQRSQGRFATLTPASSRYNLRPSLPYSIGPRVISPRFFFFYTGTSPGGWVEKRQVILYPIRGIYEPFHYV